MLQNRQERRLGGVSFLASPPAITKQLEELVRNPLFRKWDDKLASRPWSPAGDEHKKLPMKLADKIMKQKLVLILDGTL